MLKIGAIFIPVTNMKQSIEFYTNKLNFTHVGTWPDGKGADFYFYDEKQYVSLVKVEKKQPLEFTINEHVQNSYYNFTTGNLLSYYEELKQRGVKVSEIVGHGPVVGFDFYDADDNKLSVIVDKENFEGFYEEER